jgi:hypothetical protein
MPKEATTKTGTRRRTKSAATTNRWPVPPLLWLLLQRLVEAKAHEVISTPVKCQAATAVTCDA